MLAYDFDWGAVFANRDLLRHGLKNTLWIAVVSMVLATVGGLLLALLRTSRVAAVALDRDRLHQRDPRHPVAGADHLRVLRPAVVPRHRARTSPTSRPA